MQNWVQSINACISNQDSICLFSNSPESTLSHIATSSDGSNTTEIAASKIDTILGGRVPIALKIDVEGFEKKALEGADGALRDERLKAVLLGLHFAEDRVSRRAEVIAGDLEPVAEALLGLLEVGARIVALLVPNFAVDFEDPFDVLADVGHDRAGEGILGVGVDVHLHHAVVEGLTQFLDR